jgi:hypothetical protein
MAVRFDWLNPRSASISVIRDAQAMRLLLMPNGCNEKTTRSVREVELKWACRRKPR